jgi:hypothetical protein
VAETWSDFSKQHLYGNSFDFGEFKACLAFKHENIQPQHCLIQYHYTPSSNRSVVSVIPEITPSNVYWKKMNERFGGAICVPDSCTASDVRNLMKVVLSDSDYEQTDDYEQSRFCQSNKKKEFEFDTLRVTSM